jgi:hypothetical protein
VRLVTIRTTDGTRAARVGSIEGLGELVNECVKR